MKVKNLIIAIIAIPFFAIAQDFEVDKQYGKQGAEMVESQIGLYDHQSADLYVKSIGKRLVSQLGNIPLDFSFHLVDMPEPNAFALPGGYLYVTRGLLVLINEEDELAGIIGHEIIHVTKRHSVKQMKKGIIPSLLKLPGAIIGATINEDIGNIINTPINFGTSAFMANYSRKHEKEADELGIKLSSEAGYDPQKLAVILDRLSREMTFLSGEEEKKSYLSGHPFTPKRVDYINGLSEELNWDKIPNIASSKTDLFKNIEGIYFGQNPRNGIFRDSLFLHPDLNLHIVFPEKWQSFNFPVAVGAFQEKQEAMLFLTLETGSESPESAANQFSKEVLEKNDIKPDESKALLINELPAYTIKILTPLEEQTLVTELTWIQIDSVILKVVAMGLDNYQVSLQASLNSIQKLTQEEVQSISGEVLRIAYAQKNETIESLCERTNCKPEAAFIALINGKDENDLLEEGESIKIIVEEFYKN